ncbi:hypothetical protein LOK49_LG04G00347 [Camellia lanceoleosa]|uniref:Uncharacterized protein n=1 Tax=Camellia lanceoleosa TaxID=1840588 RepID=A0ACC0I6T7_9ERIC|nr:hypothetical protein LOK49_LG04G00347 [Camellia lanceoleosa]
MSAKRTVLGVQPDLTSKKSRIQEDYIYILYFHEEGPIGYAMYRIDVGAFSINENASNNAVAISPVLELPRAHYPRFMAAFAVGSRIFLIGGEIGIDVGGEIGIDDDDYDDRDKTTVRLSEMVYVCNTASALPLSFLHGTPMNGGKTCPTIIPVKKMIYVISELPTLYTYLDEDTTLFEVFVPNANEGKEKWSSLSNPPFYPSSCDDYGCGAWSWSHVSRIVSHAVVECKIFFCTTRKDHMYAFDLNCNTWERFDIYNPIGEVHFPFRDGAMSISDKSWAATGAYSESLVCTYDLTAEFGFVRKNVEDLEAITSPNPHLAYYVMDYQLLDLSNGWYCLLQFGTDDEHFRRGNQYIFASVLRLVKKRMDAVFFNDVYPWPCHCKPLTKDSCDVEKSIGQIEVFGATDLHNSLFSIGAKSFITYLVNASPYVARGLRVCLFILIFVKNDAKNFLFLFLLL